MTNEPTLAELGARRAALRAELDDIFERIRGKALADIDAGKTESEAAREAQVDRMTIRKWLGKRETR